MSFSCTQVWSWVTLRIFFRSADINLAPYFASEIILLTSSFVSNSDVAGDEKKGI